VAGTLEDCFAGGALLEPARVYMLRASVLGKRVYVCANLPGRFQIWTAAHFKEGGEGGSQQAGMLQEKAHTRTHNHTTAYTHNHTTAYTHNHTVYGNKVQAIIVLPHLRLQCSPT